HSFTVEPEELGIMRARPESLRGGTPYENSIIILRILSGRLGRRDPKRDAVLLNAAAGIVVAGKAEHLYEGLELAARSIEDGSAYSRLASLVEFTGGDIQRFKELERAA
ncbi:hypothetical protein KEJ39_08765, partial [Candidatus Bathyarchaeota archaeon]|nr:hypothetical protein [Candidatus Bathyarchaeota archaeon]